MSKPLLSPLFASALLTLACGEAPQMTFGLNFLTGEGGSPVEQATCTPPGQFSGNKTGSTIDFWKIGDPPPRLFLESTPNAEDNTYFVRIYTVTDLDPNVIWWQPDTVLAERTYDGSFGESGAEETIVVDFKGRPFTIVAQGLPPDAACP